MRTKRLTAAACVVALVVAACGAPSPEETPAEETPAEETPAEETPAERELPNSLSDTSVHMAQRAIPSYGPQASGGADSSRSAGVRGQVLYVPVYSHIFHRDEGREFDLTATLSIRNASPVESISVRAVDYFDSEGTLLKSHLTQPRRLGPLASTYVVVDQDDRSGGVGANFIVEWAGRRPVAAPLVESVMISTASTQGISFTSSARVLQEW